MSPQSQSHSTLEQEMSTSFPVTHDTSHPTLYVNVQLGLYPTDHPPDHGQLPITARIEHITLSSHAPGVPLAIPPADASLAAPLEDPDGISVEDR